jgi:hypothetical protein
MFSRKVGQMALSAAAVMVMALLAACGGNENNQKAYAACLAEAKADPKVAKAEFAAMDSAKIFSTQDANLTVRIAYELDGKAAEYECTVGKQKDDTWKVGQ